MAINILVIDEDGKTLAEYGCIETEDFWTMEKIALKNNMKMIPYINIAGDTVFNEKQLPVLEQEVAELRSYSIVNRQSLNDIDLAIKASKLTSHRYIKFWGD